MIQKTVPNQRTIEVVKEKADKTNIYSIHNLSALDQASYRLQTKGGFKLYMYLAKNQNKYCFALSSSDFCQWSGLGMTAYNSAFKELCEKGYLIPKTNQQQEKRYIFYEKSQKEEEVIIEIPKDKIEEIQNILKNS